MDNIYFPEAINLTPILPPGQEAIRQRTFHPSGQWIPLSVDGSAQSVLHYFEQHAAKQPNHLAVQSGQRQISYTELNWQANQIAHALLKLHLPGKRAVALLLDDDYDAIPAALGVWKAGMFYLQLVPSEPLARLAFALKDSQAVCLIATSSLRQQAEQLASPAAPVLYVDSLPPDLSAENPAVAPTGEMLALLSYTSGATGRPKAVIQTHYHRLIDTAVANEFYHFGANDRWIGFTLGLEFFASLAAGASLVLFDLGRESMRALKTLLNSAQITLMRTKPTIFRHLLAEFTEGETLPHLRLICLTGEPTYPRDVELFQRLLNPRTILSINLGCQETLSYCYYFVDHQTRLTGGRLSSGYPAPGVAVEICDEQGRLCPVEQPGEIVVSGNHFASAYWQNPELSAQKFRLHPEATYRVSYRTGDLGYRSTDGSITHLGRTDSRLKIRGYTIEPVEVEQALLSSGVWREAVVAGWEEGEGATRLVAYLVPNQQPPPSISAIREQLGQRLPEWMIPARFEFLDALPQLPNGKVDRRSLPKPRPERPRLSAAYTKPATAIEAFLVDLWQEVLDVRPIGIHDNFFELGGDSIRAMQLINRLEARLHDRFHFAAIFDAPTIAQMADYLARFYGSSLSIHGLADSPESDSAASIRMIDDRTIADFQQRLLARFQPDREPFILEQKNRSAIFILCPPRSGSTLLRVLLAGHPQLFAPPELTLLLYDNLGTRRKILAHTGRHEGLDRGVMQLFHLTPEQTIQWVNRWEEAALETPAFYGLLQEKLGDRMLVDKTPSYAYFPETLQNAERWFENTLYIHLARHPFGMILSGMEDRMAVTFPDWHNSRHEEVAEMTWLLAHRNILEFLRTIPAGRQYTIRFESLLAQPDSVMRGLSKFLGLPFHPGLVNPYGDGENRMVDGLYPDSRMAGDWKFHERDRIDPTVAERWRGHWRDDFLSDMTWEVASQLGYHREELPRPRPNEKRSDPEGQPLFDDLLGQLQELPLDEALSLLRGTEELPVAPANKYK